MSSSRFPARVDDVPPAAEAALARAAQAVARLRAAQIPLGWGRGSVCGEPRAFASGVVALDPVTLGLSPWSFRASARRRRKAVLGLAVAHESVEEAHRVTGLPVRWEPTHRAQDEIELHPCRVTTLINRLGADRGLDVAAFLRTVATDDTGALAFLRQGPRWAVPNLDEASGTLAVLRRVPPLANVHDLAGWLALGTPGRQREAMLDEALLGPESDWFQFAGTLLAHHFTPGDGVPRWHEEFASLLQAVLGVGPMDAWDRRLEWFHDLPEAIDTEDALVRHLRMLGADELDARWISWSLGRRNRAAFCQASMIPAAHVMLACARAQLDDEAGYASAMHAVYGDGFDRRVGFA